MTLTDDACYAALTARDRRFDGVFFTGVRTTGIYCRPICPARTPARENSTFYGTAIDAERAGFRACFRCRPEVAPGNATVDAVPSLVARAVRRIDEGALNEGSVDELGAELGVTGRHLRRSLEEHLGVAPVVLAQAQRIALAKALLQDSTLGIAEIAFASGFQSVRRFNAAFQQQMGRAPSTLRKEQAPSAPLPGVTLRLDYRPPYDAARILAFLGARAIPGVEVVASSEYRRVVQARGATGVIRVGFDERRPSVWLSVSASLLPALMRITSRVRALFDLDAHPDAIDGALSADPLLGPLVRARPGLRVPGAADPFEAGVRALLGQQISVIAARTLAGRFAERFGVPVPTDDPDLSRRFPSAAEVARVTPDEIQAIGLTRARAAALHAFATAVSDRRLRFDSGRSAPDLDGFVADASVLPGIGPWTAQYLAMRALHHPDAFPTSDLGIKKALGLDHLREIEARAAVWRPWRSYAVVHLWTALSEGDLS